VVTFVTGEKGLITALAKNARQSVRRFGGNLLRPGTAAWYHFRQRPGREVAFVERGEVNPKAPRLPADPICAALAAWALELVRAFEAHENPAQESFKLLLRHLAALSKTTDFSPPALEARRLSACFSKRYLELAGFGQATDDCSVCGRPDLRRPDPAGPDSPSAQGRWWWDPRTGGLVCSRCASLRGGLGLTPLSGRLAAALGSKGGLESANSLGEEDIATAENFFRTMASLQSGRRFKSPKVINELLSGA
jgi:DNA repair protein RecO (recombination protein O)